MQQLEQLIARFKAIEGTWTAQDIERFAEELTANTGEATLIDEITKTSEQVNH